MFDKIRHLLEKSNTTPDNTGWDSVKKVPFNQKQIYDAIPKTEQEQILQESIIDGDDFIFLNRHYKLTPDILKNARLEPKYKIIIDGTEFNFSDCFRVYQRDAVIGYIKTDNSYKVRSYYQSNSQSSWRYLPDYIVDNEDRSDILRFGKGYTEKMITLPYEAQVTLSRIARGVRVPVQKNDNPNFIFAGTAKAYTNDEYFKAMKANALRGDLYSEVSPKPQINFGALSHSKQLPEKISIAPSLQPNFQHKITQWDSYANIYGHLVNSVFPSSDNQIKYTFSEDDLGRCFISNIETNAKITSTGVRSTWVSSKDLETPIYEYDKQSDNYGDHQDTRLNYVSMWKNYLSKMPVIQDYLKSKK